MSIIIIDIETAVAVGLDQLKSLKLRVLESPQGRERRVLTPAAGLAVYYLLQGAASGHFWQRQVHLFGPLIFVITLPMFHGLVLADRNMSWTSLKRIFTQEIIS